jgi:hypothetical protein
MLLSPAVREEKAFTMKLPFSKILIGLCLGGVSLARSEDKCTGTDQLTVETATASSVEGDSSLYVAQNAVDGLQNSRWASKGPAAEGASEEQWIRFDLGGIRYIDSMLLEWERAYSREYIIKVSIDGISWTVERTFIDGNGGQVQVNQLDVFARYVQISSRLGDPNYGISLYEVTIYGKDCTIPPPPKCGETILGLDAAIASASSMEGSNWTPGQSHRRRLTVAMVECVHRRRVVSRGSRCTDAHLRSVGALGRCLCRGL